MEFGLLVRTRRKTRRWTIERLATEANLSPHYISGIENGHRDPSLSTVCAIAGAFGIEPSQLIAKQDALSPEALDVAQLFDRAAPDIQESIVRLLTAIVGDPGPMVAPKARSGTRRRGA
jgi:transcriptional regulator with XRE-family HTH domain